MATWRVEYAERFRGESKTVLGRRASATLGKAPPVEWATLRFIDGSKVELRTEFNALKRFYRDTILRHSVV